MEKVEEIPVEKEAISNTIDPINNEVIEQAISETTISEVKTEPIQPIYTSFKPKKEKDLEKYIGENLFSKIGIGILVLGIGFFVKYAIDQNWINETFRMLIGIFAGFALIGVAHWLRKDYKAFSSVLVGGGIAALYFTFAIAFHEYHLLSQSVTFVIMILVTSLAVFLSLSYDRRELAIIALLGGFVTPFLVSTGEGNYIVFLTYLLILNAGMLALSYFKNWREINIISFVITLFLLFSWYVARVVEGKDPYSGAIVYSSLFYLTFFAMNIINNLKEKRKFDVFEICILVINTFYYYAIMMNILKNMGSSNVMGLFTALLGAFNLIVAIPIYKNAKVDKTFGYLLIGFVMLFVSLIAPVQLKGASITMFWAAEVLLLYWLANKSSLNLLKYFSFFIMLFVIISLILDWSKSYYMLHTLSINDYKLSPFYNRIFLTGLFVSGSLIIKTFLLKNNRELDVLVGFPVKQYRAMLITSSLIILFVTILLELNYQLYVNLFNDSFTIVAIYSYILVFASSVLLYCQYKANDAYRIILIILNLILILFYILIPHNEIISLRNSYFYQNASLGYFSFHYITIIAVALTLYSLFKSIKQVSKSVLIFIRLYYWYLVFIILFIASSELDHIILISRLEPGGNLHYALSQIHRIGYPLLWGCTSFLIMFLGMKFKDKILRIISLSIFVITLLKLFIFDIRDISNAGKIIAFISLGILLLVVSFMYQKVKKLLLEEEDVAKSTEKNDLT